MILIEDYDGIAHYVNPSAISSISESCTSSQWHGINALVRLFDGVLIESRESPKQIFDKIETETGQ